MPNCIPAVYGASKLAMTLTKMVTPNFWVPIFEVNDESNHFGPPRSYRRKIIKPFWYEYLRVFRIEARMVLGCYLAELA